MEYRAVDYLLGRIVDPVLMPLHPGERVFWLYLVAALAIAAGLYLYRRAGKGWSLRGLLRYCLPRRLWLHRSALLDYQFFVVNRIVFGLLMLPAAPAAALGTAAAVQGGLRALLGPSPAFSFGIGAIVLQTLLSALAMDLGLFLSHRMQHNIPLLWEFHKVHHSAEVLTPVSAYRMHPVDDLLSMGLSGILFGLVVGVFQYLNPANPGPAVILGLHVAVFVYYLAGFNLRHSHAWLDYGGALGRVLISPAQHQIHHSTDPRHAGKNLGFIFSFWDAANGSLWRPARRERLQFGLAEGESLQYSGLRQLYFLPFARVLAGAAPRAGLLPLGVVLAGTIALSLGVLLRS